MIFNVIVVGIFMAMISIATWISAQSVFYMYSSESEEERDIDEMAFNIAQNIRDQMNSGDDRVGFKQPEIDKDKEDIGYT